MTTMRTRAVGAALLALALAACADEPAPGTTDFPLPPEDSAVQDVTSPDIAEEPVTPPPAAADPRVGS